MTGPEHYANAEDCLREEMNLHMDEKAAAAKRYRELAQIHAALALAAATAVAQNRAPRAADVNAWDEVASAWKPAPTP